MDQKKREISPISMLYFRIRQTCPQFFTAMLSAYLFGLLAHGMTLFQKLSVLDDVLCLFDTGATYTSGRWFLGILTDLGSFLYQSSHYSTPLLHGVFSLTAIGLTACLVIDLLELRGPIHWVLLSGMLTVFPVVASLFGYMFTAPFYALALLMTVGGVWLLCRRGWRVPVGAAFIACACGIYQAYLPTAICLLLLVFLRRVSKGDGKSLTLALRMGLGFAGAVALYYIVSKVFLALRGEVLTGYNGISGMGQEGLAVYFQRAKLALLLFLLPGKSDAGANMYPQTLGWLYPAVLLLTGLLFLRLLLRVWRRSRGDAVWLLLAAAAFPFGVNFIYIMCPTVHSLMVYAQVMPPVLLLALTEWAGPWDGKALPVLKRCAAVVLLACSLLYIRLDNVVYLREEIYQQRITQYYTAMVAQIKSLPDYTADTPVVLLTEDWQKDSTFRDLDGFGDVPPYLPAGNLRSAMSHPQAFLDVWCGFAPPMAEAADFENLPEVQQMPHYPDSGSIRGIDGTIVVKF